MGINQEGLKEAQAEFLKSKSRGSKKKKKANKRCSKDSWQENR